MKPRIPRIALERAGCWMALLMILAASVVSSQAQTPFQDARGNGSILLNDGGFIQFNIADPSIKIGYIRDISSKKKPWSLGFDVSGKLNGARASLLNKNQVAPDLKVGFTFGRKYLLTHRLDESNPNDLARLLSARAEAVKNGAKSSDDFGEYFHALPYDRLALQIGYAYKEYSLFDPNAALDKQVFKKKFHNPSAALVYSIQLDGSKLLGVSLGIGKSNNSGALTEVDVRDINSSI